MSQQGVLDSSGVSPTDIVETLTGNTGGAVGPTGGNINVVGDGTTVSIAGNPGSSTLTVSALAGQAQWIPLVSGTYTVGGGEIALPGSYDFYQIFIHNYVSGDSNQFAAAMHVYDNNVEVTTSYGGGSVLVGGGTDVVNSFQISGEILQTSGTAYDLWGFIYLAKTVAGHVSMTCHVSSSNSGNVCFGYSIVPVTDLTGFNFINNAYTLEYSIYGMFTP